MSETVRFYKPGELYKPEPKFCKPRAYKSVCSTEILEIEIQKDDISDKFESLCILG